MNKTVSVNINGLIFNIEELAFEQLNQYLERIRKYLNNSEGADEVINDIEARIGELFLENINDRKEVINIPDVEQVINTMGKPEDYVDEEAKENAEQHYTKTGKKRRRLFRDPDNQVIGGVCSGLSNYFGWEPVWLRVILILLFTLAGFGLFAYLILWIVIPKAETTAEKIMMHGEPVTVENIKKVVDQGIDALLGKSENHSSNSARTQNVKNGLSRFFNGVLDIITSVLKFIGKIVGIILLVGAMFALVLLSIALFDPAVFTFHGNDAQASLTLLDAKELFIGDSSISSLITLGLLMLIFSPLIALIYIGLKLVFRIKSNSKMIGASLLIFFVIGIGLTLYSALKIKAEHHRMETVEEFHEIKTKAKTIELITNSNEQNAHAYHKQGLLKLDDENISFGKVDFTILKSHVDGTVQLQVLKSSNGFDSKDAKERIQNIAYNWQDENGKITFDSHMKFKRSDLIRNQEVELILRLPVGKMVYLDKSMRHIIDNIPNELNMYKRDMLEHTWLMTQTGLNCVDCQELEAEESDLIEMEKDIEELEEEGIDENGSEGKGELDGSL